MNDSDRALVAGLLNALVAGQFDRESVDRALVPFLDSRSEIVRDAAHMGIHFISDFDLHARDRRYKELEVAKLISYIRRLTEA